MRGYWREYRHWRRKCTGVWRRYEGIGENAVTGEEVKCDCRVLVRIQALEKEVQQTYLSGIGEDTMDSGDNPMMTKIYSGAS